MNGLATLRRRSRGLGKRATLAGMAMALSLGCAAVVADSARSGKMLSYTCAGCHGTNGVSNGSATPTIAGMDRFYLEKAMMTFADNTRASTVMGRIARGYTHAEIRAISAFFADQSWSAATAKTDPDKVAAGAKLHQSFCIGCHGDRGTANRADVPRLAGQWPDYLFARLQSIRAGTTGLPNAATMAMQTMIGNFSDAQLQALAHYYASQK